MSSEVVLKKRHYTIWTTLPPLSLGIKGVGGKEIQTNIITIIIHLQIFKRAKVIMIECEFVEETKPEIILFIKIKGSEL